MAKPKDEKPKGDPKVRTVNLNPKPKGELKPIGGSMADDWNTRLLNNVGGSLPAILISKPAARPLLLSVRRWSI